MHHILVPTDFSDYSLNACKYAVRLASQHRAKITIMHASHIPVVDPMIPVDYLSNLAEDLKEDTAQAMKKVVKELEDYSSLNQLNSVEIISYPVFGLAVDEIIEAERNFHCDMIVMGRRRTEGMAEIFLGSIITAIVGRAKVPILIVPESVNPDKAVFDVVYASQLDSIDREILSKLLVFAQFINAKVHCLHVLGKNNPANNKEIFSELAKSYSAEKAENRIVFEKIVSEDVEGALIEYLNANQIGMLAMLTHHRSFFMKLFNRSLTKKMALKTNIPLLVYHTENNG